jgi:hypothetical protein
MQLGATLQTKDDALEQALDAVAEIESEFEKALTDAANAESDYEIEYAKAFLKADGTEKAREAKAKGEVERFLRERFTKRAIRDFMKEKMHNRQTAVSARQTLLKSDQNTNKAF